MSYQPPDSVVTSKRVVSMNWNNLLHASRAVIQGCNMLFTATLKDSESVGLKKGRVFWWRYVIWTSGTVHQLGLQRLLERIHYWALCQTMLFAGVALDAWASTDVHHAYGWWKFGVGSLGSEYLNWRCVGLGLGSFGAEAALCQWGQLLVRRHVTSNLSIAFCLVSLVVSVLVVRLTVLTIA